MLENENIIRLSAFFGTLILMLCWQFFAPRRATKSNKWSRRFNNLGLIFISSLILRFCLPLLVVTNIARIAAENQWGIFNQFAMHSYAVIIISIILLDCLIYWQHRLFHYVPMLWRLHRVHHSDKDMDATTGIRFHPIEMILSVAVKALAVIIIGAPVIAVLIFEVILNVFPLFNHSNANIPEKIDRFLRWFIVTPDMHRIHHSVYKPETNSNYGFSVSWWDRLFASYTINPDDGQTKMAIGLDNMPESESVYLHSLLLQPFLKLTRYEEKRINYE